VSTKPFPKRNRKNDLALLAQEWIAAAAELIYDAKRPFGASDGGVEFVQDSLGLCTPEMDEPDYAIEDEFYQECGDYTEELLAAMPKYLIQALKKAGALK
jgi:hypothetical protein